MNEKILRQAAVTKLNNVTDLYRAERRKWRTAPKIPARIAWVEIEIRGYSSGEKRPIGCCTLASINSDETPIDRVARTFAALQEFEAWIQRVKFGERKHQQDILAQCESKMIRLETEAAMKV